MAQQIYQDWFDHTNAVTKGALRRFRAATGKSSSHLHNSGILHDLGKLKKQLQEWYREYCFLVHPKMSHTIPLDAMIAHTLYRSWTKEHKSAEEEVNQKFGRRSGHQKEGIAFAHSQKWLETMLLIDGHHGGLNNLLPSQDSKERAWSDRFLPKDKDTTGLTQQERKDLCRESYIESLSEAKSLFEAATVKYHNCHLKECPISTRDAKSEFFIRLMFSCLVDADWEDTERWIKTQDNDYVDVRLPLLHRLYNRIDKIEQYRQKERQLCRSQRIRSLRDSVYNACLKSAPTDTGVFTLNAPTGSAKTIGALAWALLHAKKNHLRRIIYVVPYLTIIEQNAQVIRDALGIKDDELFVFEHHSIADPININGNMRQTTAITIRVANWSSPIIITTNVQFFDSLFSNQTSKCRKLHNLARSAVILDECQNVHPHYLESTCEMINQFVKYCGSSFLLCTATQPQWHTHLKNKLQAHAIIPSPGRLFARARRVKVKWELDGWTTETLVKRMTRRRQSGSIVDTRKKARELFRELALQAPADSIFHLSTSMCPLHRFYQMANLRKRLESSKKCYLSATPILEAGINISFPNLFREMAPLDLIAQSAGRSNRHGELDSGLLTVFYLLDNNGEMLTGSIHRPPDEWYQKGREVLEQWIKAEGVPDINRPDLLASYYRKLYSQGNLDEFGICQDRKDWAFSTINGKYKTISDQSRPVVCHTWHQTFGTVNKRWDDSEHSIVENDMVLKWFEHARIDKPHISEIMSGVITRVNDSLRKRPHNRWLLSLMSYFSANIFWRNFQELQETTTLITTDEETKIDFWNGPYDDQVGLIY